MSGSATEPERDADVAPPELALLLFLEPEDMAPPSCSSRSQTALLSDFDFFMPSSSSCATVFVQSNRNVDPHSTLTKWEAMWIFSTGSPSLLASDALQSVHRIFTEFLFRLHEASVYA